MKKSSFVFLFFFVFEFVILGCTTTQSAASIAIENTETEENVKLVTEEEHSVVHSVILYDSCPQNTYALKAELSLKTTIKKYDGKTLLILKKLPSKENINKALEYYSYCLNIAQEMQKGLEVPVTLSFIVFDPFANGKSNANGFV